MSEEEKNKKKDIEVVTGDGTDLDISTVYDYVKIDKQDDDNKKKNIVIPEGSSSDNDNNENKK